MLKRLLFTAPVALGGMVSMVLAQAPAETSLRDVMRSFERPPLFQYVWAAEVNDELTQDRLEDWRRMGFTGFQKTHTTGGGRHFEHGEIVTLLRYSQFPQHYEDDDGQQQVLFTLFGDLAHPANPGVVADWIEDKVEREGDNLFRVGDRYLMLTGDEYDLHYGRRQVKHRWAGEHHLAAWRAFLQADYGDATPGQDSNSDGRTYNAQAVKPIQAWAEAPKPKFENRFAEPYVWETYRRFLVELNHGYFEKVEAEAQKRGLPVDLVISSHGSVFYPGGPPSMIGGDPYTQGHRSAALVQEAVFPDWPTQSIAHAFFNRYSREYGAPVLAWSWFWPGSRHRTSEQFMDDVELIDRQFARLFQNEVHGLLYWTYTANVRNFNQATRIAYWHQWWLAHWKMLRDAPPTRPRVALLFPNRAADFYLAYDYPKKDFAFTAQALIDLQVPYTCIGEYELEAGKGLDGIELLLIAGAERISRRAAGVIDRFIESGGKVWASGDSLAMNTGGESLGLLEKRFAVRLAHKHKRSGYESILSVEEEAWVRGEEGAVLPDRTPYGATQSAFDKSDTHWVELEGENWPLPRLRTVNEIVTGQVLNGGRVLGRYRGDPVIVQTDRTLWVGTRVGADLSAAMAHKFMNEAYEPLPEDWPELARSVRGRAPYAALVDRAVEMAGIVRPAEVFDLSGQRANRIEVGVRDLSGGGVLVVLSDRDVAVPRDADVHRYALRLAGDHDQHVVWDLLNDRALESRGDGEFLVEVPTHSVAYVLAAPRATIDAARQRQADVDAMDLDPKPYRHGPRGGPIEPPIPQVRFTGSTKVGRLPGDVVAQLVVSVTNPTDYDKPQEPIRLTGAALLEVSPGLSISRVSSDDAQVQWLGNHPQGLLTADDVIAWQADLPAGQTRRFTLRLHVGDGPGEPASADASGDFTASVSDAGVRVVRGGRLLFATNEHGEWHFNGVTMADGSRLSMRPMTGFILNMAPQPWLEPATTVLKLRSAQVIVDGPVFKTIRLTFADDRDVFGTVADYTIYAQQPDDEVRIYANVAHRIDEMVDLWKYPRPPLFHDQRTMTAAVLTMEQSQSRRGSAAGDARTWYADALGRFSSARAHEVNNFGGWIATQWRDRATAQVSFRRVRGVRELVMFQAVGTRAYQSQDSEADGLQVLDNSVVRAGFRLGLPSPTQAVDMRIPEGTRWHLDTLISLRSAFDETVCRQARADFAAPPLIAIEHVTRSNQP